MAANTHFTAVLTIHETAEADASGPSTFDRRVTAPTPTRETAEVAKIVVRAKTLPALRDKVAEHAALLD